MAKASAQKQKILYVLEYFQRYTDEEHPASIADLTDYLEERDITVQRKTLYDDIETLRAFGLDILMTNEGRSYGYYLASRDFELPELKLLVDSVQSSKFITHKKTEALIGKIEKLTSVHRGKLLQRQVFVRNRIKTMNESIYYNVDSIHSGISENRQIRFRYFDFTPDKKRHYRHDGGWYTVSPYALTWDDENYYMVAYDTSTGVIRHYRVDKMTDISTVDRRRDGEAAFRELDLAEYAKTVFGMFAGEPVTVLMRFDNRLAGAVLDRLGRDVMMIPDGDGHFTVSAKVVASTQFFAWIFGFGPLAEIKGPSAVLASMKDQLRKVAALYGDGGESEQVTM